MHIASITKIKDLRDGGIKMLRNSFMARGFGKKMESK